MEKELEEFELIVEFSFLIKQSKFVVRFLDGSSYVLNVADLPKKMQTKKPDWENASLSPARNSLIVIVGDEIREILSHIIHSRGREL